MTSPQRRAGQLGRLPAVPTKPRLRIAPYRLAAPPPPDSADWYSRVPSLPMYANDTVGDCTYAEIGHQAGTASAYTGTEVLFTDAQILAGYSRLTGYNAADPSTDQGAVIQDVLNDWRKNGIGDPASPHRCLAFAEADVSDLTEIKQCVAAFGSVDIGCSVYSGDMHAFDANQPWDTAYGKGSLEGGHSVEIVGYDAQGGRLVTWGQLQQFTWNWWKARVEEAWLVVLSEWLDAHGQSPSGFDLYGLGQRMTDLTGDPNPFPQPAPAPPVPQPPGPPQPPADADAAYAGDARLIKWARARHASDNGYAAKQFLAWKAAKNL